MWLLLSPRTVLSTVFSSLPEDLQVLQQPCCKLISLSINLKTAPVNSQVLHGKGPPFFRIKLPLAIVSQAEMKQCLDHRREVGRSQFVLFCANNHVFTAFWGAGVKLQQISYDVQFVHNLRSVSDTGMNGNTLLLRKTQGGQNQNLVACFLKVWPSPITPTREEQKSIDLIYLPLGNLALLTTSSPHHL